MTEKSKKRANEIDEPSIYKRRWDRSPWIGKEPEVIQFEKSLIPFSERKISKFLKMLENDPQLRLMKDYEIQTDPRIAGADFRIEIGDVKGFSPKELAKDYDYSPLGQTLRAVSIDQNGSSLIFSQGYVFFIEEHLYAYNDDDTRKIDADILIAGQIIKGTRSRKYGDGRFEINPKWPFVNIHEQNLGFLIPEGTDLSSIMLRFSLDKTNERRVIGRTHPHIYPGELDF